MFCDTPVRAFIIPIIQMKGPRHTGWSSLFEVPQLPGGGIVMWSDSRWAGEIVLYTTYSTTCIQNRTD